MEIFKQIAPLRTYLDRFRKSEKSIGLVPTMGALHRGHISLIQTSKSQNTVTVATIYVNPTQFNNPKDLQKYPKTPEMDMEMLQEAGCDVVFIPENPEMYAEEPVLKFDFGHLNKVMEGKFRPGHFSGVALVVSKLFNIVQPNRAYFGQKDWQQFAVIRQLVSELKFNFELYSVPILRETDGLAMSSRNLRLSQAQRSNAVVFHQALVMAKNALAAGEGLETVKKAVFDMVNSKPEIKLEYFELADSRTLTILDTVDNGFLPILCIAGFAGEIRLIDNMFLD